MPGEIRRIVAGATFGEYAVALGEGCLKSVFENYC
jgi:hypothetical protein